MCGCELTFLITGHINTTHYRTPILFIVYITLSDEAPLEILARGPKAKEAYIKAIQEGKTRVFRTRLMIVGQERVGKTSLKKSLTGQTYVTFVVVSNWLCGQ